MLLLKNRPELCPSIDDFDKFQPQQRQFCVTVAVAMQALPYCYE